MLLLAVAPVVQAQMFQDPSLQALHERPDAAPELQRAARARLAADRADTQAVLALGVAALARDDAQARRAAAPEQARVDLQAGHSQRVLETLAPLLGSRDAAVAEDALARGFAAATRLINDDKPAEAEAFLQQLARERPESAAGSCGLARARVAAGQHEQALALYDQAARATDHATYPIDYRRGLSLQALGRNAEARAAFTRFVERGRGQQRSLEDARKRLQSLG